ncbi:hypothetical protein Rhopal_002875-T1 [Rhodotorula paludigena]|uniref:Protein FRA10AC1 n=1 Tax=Rhodotorula paludigena TaxID=86838 RepID=A0AAV5GBQ1_9BASI|nr:hypothetical protein Rhopal_002875-T1 [Rhodotorula paludigena]
MSSYSGSHPGDPGPSTSKRRRVETFEPETAHERHQRLYRLKSAYERGKVPAKPQSKNELDVLKERHQFVRDSNVDPASLAWEDQLAYKYYETLFKEFALVNLKHYRSGAVALRWRTEDEVLSGIGHLTCASLRCEYHEPSPAILAALEEDADVPPDPDSTTPLVEVRLEEMQMPFGYVERGEKKTTLVKVVLCRECGKKLRYGRQKAKEEREKKTLEASGGAERARDERGLEPAAASGDMPTRRASEIDGAADVTSGAHLVDAPHQVL